MKIEITQVEFLTDDDYVEILTIDAGDIKLEVKGAGLKSGKLTLGSVK